MSEVAISAANGKVYVLRSKHIFLISFSVGLGLAAGRLLTRLLFKQLRRSHSRSHCHDQSCQTKNNSNNNNSSNQPHYVSNIDKNQVFSATSPDKQVNGYTNPATLCSRFYPMHPSSLSGLSPIIVPSSTFLMKDAEHGARMSSRGLGPLVDDDGYLYARWGSPTNQMAAQMLSNLEGAKGTHLFSSGMAAITTTLVALLSAGDHVVVPQAAYGGVSELLNTVLNRLGVQVTIVDATRIEEYEKSIKPNTKLVYAETVCNPTLRLTNIKALGALAKSRGIQCVVDGTFSTPYHTRCLSYEGVTAVVNAGTKYLGGHSDIMCGAVSSNDIEFLKLIGQTLKLLGGNLSAFDAFLLARGIKSFDVRMERHASNAFGIARFLASHPAVSRVWYPGLESHEDHSLARSQMIKGFSGMVTFEVIGGVEGGKKCVEALKLINLAVSLGSTESLICHSASTTHTMVNREVRLKSGITDGMIRFSVGLEDIRDLQADLKQALDQLL